MVHAKRMTPQPESIPIKFWTAWNGREPVREFLKELPKVDRLRIGENIRQLQFGWPIGMPLVRKLPGDIWELRSSLPSKREVRILFATDGRLLVLLHAFVKKSQKTPRAELAVAGQRLKELQV
jgi:phage-related protein